MIPNIRKEIGAPAAFEPVILQREIRDPLAFQENAILAIARVCSGRYMLVRGVISHGSHSKAESKTGFISKMQTTLTATTLTTLTRSPTSSTTCRQVLGWLPHLSNLDPIQLQEGVFALGLTMHVPRVLPRFRKSYALLTTASCKQIAIFVHGFFGKSTSTWRNFQGLIDEPPSANQWNATDLFFYNYDSRRPIGIAAQDFSTFLGAVMDGDIEKIAPTDFLPQPIISPQPPSVWKKRSYQSLLLIAHSEGGVVVRRALLNKLGDLERQAQAELGSDAVEERITDAVKQHAKADLTLNAKLRLFAPACLGINFSSMFGFALAYSDILYALAASFPARNDLADDSPIIIQIKDETEAAEERYRSLSSFTAHVLFGEYDHIVHFGGYKRDLVLPYEQRQSHTGICKPTASYLKPLRFAE